MLFWGGQKEKKRRDFSQGVFLGGLQLPNQGLVIQRPHALGLSQHPHYKKQHVRDPADLLKEANFKSARRELPKKQNCYSPSAEQ